VEKRPTAGELLCDAAVGDYVLRMYESQLDCVSEREVYLKDEEIKKMKEQKNDKVKKVRKKNEKINKMQEKIRKIRDIEEEKKEKIKKIKKRAEKHKLYNSNLRKKIINLQEEIVQLRNKGFLFYFILIFFYFFFIFFFFIFSFFLFIFFFLNYLLQSAQLFIQKQNSLGHWTVLRPRERQSPSPEMIQIIRYLSTKLLIRGL
jgi:uncharacterized membrane protein